jgi:ribosomal protein S18 acetylase RimI-like enzyme
MEINPAKPSDLIEILFLIKVCTQDMNAKGFRHWNSSFPDTEQIMNDLQGGTIYLAKDKGVCKGMVALNKKEPEEYKSLSFKVKSTKALYLQNMAVHPTWQGKGIANQMVDFAQNYARENGFDCIRLDIFKPSEIARQLYEKNSFKEVASFHTEYQKIPFICYEKQL